MRTAFNVLAALFLAAGAAHAAQSPVQSPVPRPTTPDPAVVAQCRALALEMVGQVQSVSTGPAMTQPQRAANTAMNLAATAARMAGGAAGAMTAEILTATAAEAQAAAEEARANAVEALGGRLDAIERRMQAAGCTDAVMGAASVFQ